MTPEQRRRYEQAAPVKKRQPASVLRDWIERCLEDESKLTNWEIGFLYDMDSKLSDWGCISEAQEEKLEQIYAERTK
jgi:hypothetical protein